MARTLWSNEFGIVRQVAAISLGVMAFAASLLAQGATDPARVPIDNDFVRVARAVEEVGHRSRAHGHPNSKVSVFLDAGEQTLVTTADGGRNVRVVKPGDAIFDLPVVEHVSLNTAKTRLRVVQVDIKKKAGEELVAVAFDPRDPVKADPAHFSVVAENGQVRVLRLRLPAGARTAISQRVMPSVTVFLTAATLRLTGAGGAITTESPAQHDVRWEAEPSVVGYENAGANAFEAILVEVKAR